MPLSEDDQRIFREIEQTFYEHDPEFARRVAEIAPDIPTGILQTSYPVDPIRPLRDARARDLWQQWELIDPPLVALAHEGGARVIAWTVNDRRRARQLADWGVDAICTDTLPTIRQA